MSVIAIADGPAQPILSQAASASIITAETLPASSRSWTEEREALIAFLRGEYDLASEPAVTYLRRNSELAWLLVGAKPVLEESFRGPVGVTLRVVRDPEEDDSEEHLFGYISCALPLVDALDALDRFDYSTIWIFSRAG